MRVRSTTTGGFTTPHVWQWRNRPVGSWNPTTSYSGTETVKTITDVVTPRFHSRLECGEFLPLNPMSVVTTTVTAFPASGSFQNRYKGTLNREGTGTRAYQKYARQLFVPPPDQSKIDSVVLSAQSSAANFEWDVLTFLAELRSTVDTMAGLGRAFNARTSQLAAEAAAFRRNPWKRFRELWLGARYSIRPIVYDFQSAANALSSLIGDGQLISGKGYLTESDDSFFTDEVIVDNYQKDLIEEELTWWRSYRSVAYLRVGSGIRQRFGADPLVTAWELTPYSFVLDWFINIGAWVSTITPSLTGRFLGTCVSVRTHYEHRQQWQDTRGSWVHPDYTSTGGSGPIIRTTVEDLYERYPYDGVPLPSFDPRLTIPKLIDLVALFVKGKRDVNQRLGTRR